MMGAYLKWLWWELTFSDSLHDGLGHGRSGSAVTMSIRFWKRIRAQSMIRMMRWGGLASLRTVDMWAALIVCKKVDLFCKIIWGILACFISCLCFDFFYWMFYDHFSARSLLAKLGRFPVSATEQIKSVAEWTTLRQWYPYQCNRYMKTLCCMG